VVFGADDALIGAVAGPIIGGMFGMYGQNQANAANAAQSDKNVASQKDMMREQMAFQDRMSSSAYQRSTEDMRKAGLNPMLAFSQGGASTPSGSSGSGAQATMGNEMSAMGSGISSAVSSAMDLKRVSNDTKATQSNVDLNEQKSRTEETVQQAQTANAKAATEQAKKTAVEAENLRLRQPAVGAEAKRDKGRAEIDSSKPALYYDAIQKRLLPVLDTGAKYIPFGGGGRGTDRTIDRETGEILIERKR